jgi:hypothetical protein
VRREGSGYTAHEPCGEYFGKYRGTVTNPVDTAMMGRITATVTVGGSPLTVVANACTPFAGPGCGFYAIPPQGAGVWIEFEEGDLDRPIYTGCYWREGEIQAMLTPDTPAPSAATAPDTLVLRTPLARLKMNIKTGEMSLESLIPPSTPGTPTAVHFSKTSVEITYGPTSSIKLDASGVSINGTALQVLPGG